MTCKNWLHIFIIDRFCVDLAHQQMWGMAVKCLVVLVGLLMCLNAGADTFAPSLIYPVEPQYPTELQRMGMSGLVRVHVMVSAEGSVVDPNIFYSAHPAFSSATQDVIREWRFSSWPPEGDSPKQVEMIAWLVLSLGEGRAAVGDIRTFDLGGATCLQLNNEIAQHRRRNINVPLTQLTLFAVTQHRLIDLYVEKKLSAQQFSDAMSDFSQGMIKTTRTCQKKVSRPFVEALPQSVQALRVPSTQT